MKKFARILLFSMLIVSCFVVTGAVAADVAGIYKTPASKTADGGSYATLQKAIDAVSEDQIIKLSADINETVLVESADKKFTIDLNNHTWYESKDQNRMIRLNGGNLTITNGTLLVSTDTTNTKNIQAIQVIGTKSSDYAGKKFSTLTISSDVHIENRKPSKSSRILYGIYVWGNLVSDPVGNGIKIDVYGTISAEAPIFVSGLIGTTKESSTTMAKSGPEINVYGTLQADKEEGSQGVILNGYARVNVYDGAKITGGEGIGVKSGILNVYGGKIAATGAIKTPVAGNNSGSEESGGGIAITSRYSFSEGGAPFEVNIYSGDISSTNNAALLATHSENGTKSPFKQGLKVNIYGGNFASTSGKSGDIYIVSADTNDIISVDILGGTFQTSNYAKFAASIDKYVHTGFASKDNGDKTTTVGYKITITTKSQDIAYGTSVDVSIDKVVVSPDLSKNPNPLYKNAKLTSIDIKANTKALTTTGKVSADKAIIMSGDIDVTKFFKITYVSNDLKIHKAIATVKTAPAAVANLRETSSAQNLVTAGVADGGTMVYLVSEAEPAATAFKTTIPQGTKAGTYKVWYMVSADANHENSKAASLNVTIAPATTPVAPAVLQSLAVAITKLDPVVVDSDKSKDVNLAATITGTFSNSTTQTLTLPVTWAITRPAAGITGITLTNGVLHVVAANNTLAVGDYSLDISATVVSNSITGTGRQTVTVSVIASTGAGSNELHIPEGTPIADYVNGMDPAQQDRITTTANLSTAERTAMTDADVNALVGKLSNLEKLDLQDCTNITKLEKTDGNKKIDTITLDGCDKLAKVDLSGFESLEKISGLSGSKSLTDVDITDCPELEALDVSSCDNLVTLDCSSNDLGTLKVENCPKLESLVCSDNSLTSITLDGCSSLSEFKCDNNSIENIDVSATESLKDFSCGDNRITSLKGLEKSKKSLTKFDARRNRLGALNMGDFEVLDTLEMSGQTASQGFSIVRGIISLLRFIGIADVSDASIEEVESVMISDVTDGLAENIDLVVGYDSDGKSFDISYDPATGEASTSKTPAKIVYYYDTGFDADTPGEASMDVTVSQSSESGTNNNPIGGGSSGGCNSGLGLMSVIMLAGFALRKKNA